MASKFSEFLQKNKIDPRRLIVASRQLERLRPEDRALRRQRSAAKAGDAKPAEGEEQKAPTKPRSGRPLTPRLVADAGAGKPLSGAAKTRLLRALNRVLEQKKKAQTELRALF